MSEAAAPRGPFPGLFNDGHSTAVHTVEFRIEAPDLVIEKAAGTSLARWPLRQLIRHPDGTQGELRVGMQGHAGRLTIADPAAAAALMDHAPQLRAHRGGAGATARLALSLGLISAAILAALYFGVPWLSERAAPLIPATIESRIGQRYYAAIKAAWPPCPLDDTSHEALTQLTVRLLGDTDVPFDITVDVIDMKLENAFALPGGHVLVTTKLIERMESPDELAGVIAHELGHVIERHTMIAVVQDTGLSIVLLVLTGGNSGSGEWAISSAGQLAQLSYSRRLEERADERGIALLKAAKISPVGLAKFFERLAADDEEDGGLKAPDFLHSHPPTAARAALAKEAASPGTSPAMSAEQWIALKELCVRKKDEPEDKAQKPKGTPAP